MRGPSERTSKWLSTSNCIFGCSGPQCNVIPYKLINKTTGNVMIILRISSEMDDFISTVKVVNPSCYQPQVSIGQLDTEDRRKNAKHVTSQLLLGHTPEFWRREFVLVPPWRVMQHLPAALPSSSSLWSSSWRQLWVWQQQQPRSRW